jgi:hypothetical protein
MKVSHTDGSVFPYADQPFLSSKPIDLARIKDTSAFTRFAARISNSDYLADAGSRRARLDYLALVSHSPPHCACESPVGNFNSLMYFDCLPDRMEILSYFNELAFLHDGEGLHLCLRNCINYI